MNDRLEDDMSPVWRIASPRWQIKRRNCLLLPKNQTLLVKNKIKSHKKHFWSHILKVMKKRLTYKIFLILRQFGKRKREENCLDIHVRNVKFLCRFSSRRKRNEVGFLLKTPISLYSTQHTREFQENWFSFHSDLYGKKLY